MSLAVNVWVHVWIREMQIICIQKTIYKAAQWKQKTFRRLTLSSSCYHKKSIYQGPIGPYISKHALVWIRSVFYKKIPDFFGACLEYIHSAL